MFTSFFHINRDIFFFAYGLAFFIMGVTILLQTRHSSRLELARSLVWLALFGITHGLNEWGDFFIPKQAIYLSLSAINGLYVLQLLILSISFTCLFEFGVTMLNPLGLGRWMHSLPLILFSAWFIAVFFFISPFVMEMEQWRAIANALARYFICLPGGLIAAYGLRQQTNQRIVPLNVPSIVQNLRVAGVSMAVYGLLAGIIPPAVPFFPGTIINMQTFSALFGIPVLVFRSLIALVMTITIINGLEIFDLETQQRIEKLEQQQMIVAERERLARDLHDGAIQKVYTAGLLVESASKLAPPESELENRIQKAVVVLNDAIADLRLNLTELHSNSNAVEAEPLTKIISTMANDPRYIAMVKIGLDMEIPLAVNLSPLRSDHLKAIINEVFANIVRHSKARHVHMKTCVVDEKIIITIKDDGIGMSNQQPAGYGLRNMRDRAYLLHGKIDINSVQGRGTTVSLEIPLLD
jgi:signal transduction histidine kinase